MNPRPVFKSIFLNPSSLQRISHNTLRLVFVILLAFGIVFSGASGISLAQLPPDAGAAADAEHLTNHLVGLMNRYLSTSPADRSKLQGELINPAVERWQLLLSLIENDPGEVLRLALPKRLNNGMPALVQTFIEQWRELEGTLEVIEEDYEDGSRLRYLLNVNGERISLYFKARPPRVLSGLRVRARGVQMDDAMALESGETGLQILALDGEESVTAGAASAAVLPNAFGEQRTLVLLVNFRNDPTNEPWTVEEARDLVFGTVNDFFKESSFGQTWLTGEVYGWYTLPFDQPTDSTTCKTAEVARLAQEAARNAGVNLSAFDRYIYVFPQTPCFPSGSGTVGGNPSEAWINGSWFRLKTVGHELGHNLGLFHSAALECGDTTLGTDFVVYPYGDTMDIMGNQSVGHFNAFQKERLGWLDPGLSDIITADRSGTYTLEAYETDRDATPNALKVLKDTDPVTGGKTWYYIEYRQALGFDDFLAGSNYMLNLNGVVVHMANESDPGSSVLLDMTPGSSLTWDWGDPALVFGRTFSDPENGISITSLSGDGGTATVAVSFDTPICVRANPIVATSPAESQWVAAGTTATYTVTVSNTTSTGCPASFFDLTAGIPQGWTAVWGTDRLEVQPGASAATTLEITSAPSAAVASYTIDITAQDIGDPACAASASLTYIVSRQSDNEAPVAVDDSASTTKLAPVVIYVLNNDSDPDNDPLTVKEFTQGSMGTVTFDASGRATYTPVPKAKGKDSFFYTITDGICEATAAVQVSFTKTR